MFGSKLEVKRFEDSIRKYEALPVVTDKILFYGHSLFTRCSAITNFAENPKLEECVRRKDGSQAVVNHGFGTSSADDLLYYYDRMVRPYHPRVLVIATYSNDHGFGYNAKEIMEIQARVIDWARADFPGIKFYCFNATPTLKNKGQKNAATRIRDEYNQLLEAYCGVHSDCVYVPLQKQVLYFEKSEDVGDYNKIREDIFMDDAVHLNPAGYEMFMGFVRDLLDDLL